jgi:hypothetical protein
MGMNMGGLTHALKGINGTFEVNRLIGGIGGLVYVICANAFVAYEVIWLGKPFDITAYCLAFPGGVAMIAGGTAGAVALKDRNVASAVITQQTGAIPAKPPEGPQVPVAHAEPEVSLAAAAAAAPRPAPLAPPPAQVVEPANL